MNRVVVTGLGIVSSIGNNKKEVFESLKNGTSGVSFKQEYKDMGLRSHLAASIDIDVKEHIERKLLRFMGKAAAYSYIALTEAIKDSGLTEDEVSNTQTGLIMGSGGASSADLVEAADILRNKGVKRVGPYRVTQTMSSTISACLATPFKIKGINYSISSACATSAHCIGSAMEQIQFGKQKVVFAGGGEEEHWTQSCLFDAMGALSTRNDSPDTASRAYDVNRDGFVISGGAGALVLEELEHAKARGANIYAELVGYGATSDGYNMVSPSGEGAVRCMKQALDMFDGQVDYINAHGTSTPAGDLPELRAMREVFTDNTPKISSTKSLTGHSQGAAGVHEAIYSLIMMQHNFICASANIEKLDPEAEGLPIVQETMVDIEVNSVMSNSFGFGGTNASLIFQRYK
jgi:3-oxoacyl-[acyl-carrier-protein] synthase-1